MRNVREIAQQLGVSVSSVYALVSSGRLSCHRIGSGRGAIRISESDLEDYLLTCRQGRRLQNPMPRRVKLKHLRL
jgi:excisionase family DNA binding protein